MAKFTRSWHIGLCHPEKENVQFIITKHTFIPIYCYYNNRDNFEDMTAEICITVVSCILLLARHVLYIFSRYILCILLDNINISMQTHAKTSTFSRSNTSVKLWRSAQMTATKLKHLSPDGLHLGTSALHLVGCFSLNLNSWFFLFM